ncbi:methionine synthase [Haloarculaceae archaeon H-GB2-1]|nr:methionine synthase [Haloarculaceae archaeon H-GB1-1]MEA5386381.1 methionine synthase [Haloarculaceae archaeon H-GB11]MEA5407889.1 methionine synthase [Haloarculaceae archaeon H-GB2-1]
MTRDQFRPKDADGEHFLLTTVVGSYPQPAWLDAARDLVDEDALSESDLAEAEDDAVKAVTGDMCRAGLDVVTDGEQRRTGMVEYFAQFVDNYENDGDGDGWNSRMPTVTGEVASDSPWLVDDYEFAAEVSERPVKTTITGPFTLASFCSMEAYDNDVEALAYDMADLVAAEASRLADAGARWIQVDEPALGMSPHADIAQECLTRIDAEVPDDVRLGVHICSGEYENLVPEMFEFPVDEVDLEFASTDADDPHDLFEGVDLPIDIGYGVVDTQSKDADSVDEIVERIEHGLEVIPADRMTVATDCGLKPLPRDAAEEKIQNMVAAARRVEAGLNE